MVADKGYHSGAVLEQVKSYEVRTYHSGKETSGAAPLGKTKTEEQQAVYQNRRRVRGSYGQKLTAAARRTGGAQLCTLRTRRAA